MIEYSDEDEDDELLNVDDLEDLPALSRFKYTLRVGDVIRYKPFDEDEKITATVVEIGESNFHDEPAAVRTSSTFAVLDWTHNDGFEVVSSRRTHLLLESRVASRASI